MSAAADTSEAPLARRIPASTDTEALLDAFLAYASDKGLTLYPAQEEALLELFDGKHVILETPTGSGKSLVAAGLALRGLACGVRTFYAAPIKALVSEKFFDLCRELGAERVGLMTGDATVNRDAPVVCCTAEILASMALHEGERADVGAVVMDEFHYYGDRDRGVAWQVPLLLLPRAQFLLMSATLGDVASVRDDLAERTGREVAWVRGATRPVPLSYEYRSTPLHETVAELLETQRSPVYVVHFAQRAAAEHAQDLMSTEVVSRERKQAIREALHGFRWDTPFGKELSRWVRHGVGVHHAGLLPKYRLLVEKLAQEGLLAIICGTDTLGVGVNVPIRSVLFTQLCKYDGERTAVLTVRDFKQIAGRAGRKGHDDHGYVLAQAPAHVIENDTARRKAEGDAKKTRKLVPRKPPERGYAHWDESTFEKLASGDPERLVSRFRMSHGMLLAVMSGAIDRGDDPCRAMRTLIERSHERRPRKFALGRHAIALLRSLRAAGVMQVEPGDGGARRLVIDHELQADFSLHHSLSLFVGDGVAALDRESPDYPADVLSVVESVLEDPSSVLARQLDVVKEREMSRMKAEGLEFEERIKRLDEVRLPQPCAEVLLPAFEAFAAKHPWVGKEDLRLKSVARDLYERGATFSEYVREWGLVRMEGALLRYLSDAYKALAQSVPEPAKTDDVHDLEDWLRTTIRLVDSSLLDEWEALAEGAPAPDARPVARDATEDPHALAVMARNAMFALVRALSRRDLDEVARRVRAPEGEAPWTVERLEAEYAAFEVAHGKPRVDGAARAPACTRVAREGDALRVEQVLLDDDDERDYWLEASIDLAALRETGEPAIVLHAIRGA